MADEVNPVPERDDRFSTPIINANGCPGDFSGSRGNHRA